MAPERRRQDYGKFAFRRADGSASGHRPALGREGAVLPLAEECRFPRGGTDRDKRIV